VTASAPGAGGAAFLAVEGLTTVLGAAGGNSVVAVDEVDLRLAAGDTLGIVGESGSGKSVLVRSIMGLLPDHATVSGRVELGGRDLLTLGRKEREALWGVEIATVFQDPMTALNPVRRIGVQLTDPLRYHLGMRRREARTRAVELLAMVGVPAPTRRMEQYPHELSGGLRQRICIAIALSCSPSLLIADEPTTALDVTVQRQVLDLLAELQGELGMTMILISHDLGVVRQQADTIAVMYAGRIVEQAGADALFRSVRHPYTRGLLQSTPRLEDPSHTPLTAIPGRPIRMTSQRVGCSFAPRCALAQPVCAEVLPPLLIDGHDGHEHRAECHFPLEVEHVAPVEPVASPVRAPA